MKRGAFLICFLTLSGCQTEDHPELDYTGHERFRFLPGEQPMDPELAETLDGTVLPQATLPNGLAVWLNYDGATLTRGGNSAPGRQSFILNVNTANIQPWSVPQSTKDAVTDCVRNIFAPYDFRIYTNEADALADGGQDYIMAIAAGRNSDIGSQALGVAPFSCNNTPRGIDFSFAEQVSDQRGPTSAATIKTVCEVVAQELGHHVTAQDHQYLNTDIFTYLNYSGGKTIVDESAPCGEFQPRACMCGGTSKNSHDIMETVVGLSANGGVTNPGAAVLGVTMTHPIKDSVIKQGVEFPIRVDVASPATKVDFLINNELVGTDISAPYEHMVTTVLAKEQHLITARVTGANGTEESISTLLTIGDETIVPGTDENDEAPWNSRIDPSDIVGSCSSGNAPTFALSLFLGMAMVVRKRTRAEK